MSASVSVSFSDGHSMYIEADTLDYEKDVYPKIRNYQKYHPQAQVTEVYGCEFIEERNTSFSDGLLD